MEEITVGEIRLIEDALTNIARELNQDKNEDIEFFCKKLKDNLQDIAVGIESCNKIEELNVEARKLKQETIEMYKNIVEFMKKMTMISNQ